MTISPEVFAGNFLPETIEIPVDNKEQIIYLKTRLEEILRLLNRKDNGSYEQVEQLNNQQYFGANPQTKRYVYRRVYAFGAIGVGAALNIAHGIVGITTVTRLYGTINTAADDRPLPYVDTVAVTNQVSVLRNGANIVIQNGATAPAIVSGLVVIEYLKS